MERTSAVTGNLFEIQPMPEPARKYVLSSTLSITQHRDSVWYVTGCAALGRVDTTVFLMFGADSTRRLSAPQRTFGEAMATGLIGQMRTAVIKERTLEMNLEPRALPPMRNQCVPIK
jgi:hypothetical protein